MKPVTQQGNGVPIVRASDITVTTYLAVAISFQSSQVFQYGKAAPLGRIWATAEFRD